MKMQAITESQSPAILKMQRLNNNPENKIRYLESQIKERDSRISRLEDKLLEKGINPWNI